MTTKDNADQQSSAPEASERDEYMKWFETNKHGNTWLAWQAAWQAARQARPCVLAPKSTTNYSEIIPTGWKLVPIKPTEEMLDSLYRMALKQGETTEVYEHPFKRNLRCDYKAMLAAAPSVGVQSNDSDRKE